MRIFLLFAIFSSYGFAQIFCYENSTIFVEDKFVKSRRFCFDDRRGVIVDGKSSSMIILDGTNQTIIPGLIDIQINGGFGFDFTTTPQSVSTVAKQLAKTGVTAFSPTLISSLPIIYRNAARHITPSRKPFAAEILKLHCEGPFITKAGVHSTSAIKIFPKSSPQQITFDSVRRHYGPLFRKIGLITLAPEQHGGGELISAFKKNDIVVSLGHSNASLEDGLSALRQGANFFTHLFNAMPQLHHRDPGLVAAALVYRDAQQQQSYYGMIVDGIHVHPCMIELAFNANKNMIVVTDAMAALGLSKEHSLRIGDQEVQLVEHKHDDGTVALKAIKAHSDGKEILAGSVISMIDSLNNLRRFLQNASWAQIIMTATTNPARLMGMLNSRNLDVGSYADFLVVDGDFLDESGPKEIVIKNVIIGGKWIERNEPIQP